MARNNPEGFVKRNNKLETFLKRNLDEDTFERLRVHEACIVCSEKNDKAFKFVILGDEWIWLTENPPKKIEQAVHLGDIVNIQLVNDFPSFLSGEERENTQHLSVEYVTAAPPKGRKGRPSLKPSNGASLARFRNGTASRTSGSRRTSTLEVPSGAASRRASIDAEVLRDALDDATSGRTKLKAGRPFKKHSTSQLPDLLSPSETTFDSPRDRSRSVAIPEARALPVPPAPSSRRRSRNSDTSSDLDDKDHPLDRRKGSDPLALSQTTGGDLCLALEKLIDEQRDGDGASLSSRSPGHTPRLGSLSNSSSRGNLEDVEDEDSEPYRKAVLHLYILNLHSPTLMLLMSARQNYLVRATLLQDQSFATMTTGYAPKTQAGEKMAQLFGQLKTELLNGENSMEETFHLLSELKVSAQRHFSLRKLFWKTPELFLLMVRVLQKYMPKPRSRKPSNSEEFKLERADEFELVILTVDTLSVMVQETEMLSSRIQTLASSKGKHLMDLVQALTCFPEMPQKYVPPSSQAAALLNTAQADQWQSSVDAELSKLLREFTRGATGLLAEIMLIAQQSNWGLTSLGFFNIGWLMNVLEEMNTTEKFVERLVGQAMRLISPSRSGALSPPDAVQVYQQFFVLDILIEHSPRIACAIRNNFFEEFKYFIQVPILHAKLPAHYPISQYALRLMQRVVTAILQRKVDLKVERLLREVPRTMPLS